jgi:hypothetical protein
MGAPANHDAPARSEPQDRDRVATGEQRLREMDDELEHLRRTIDEARRSAASNPYLRHLDGRQERV